VKPGWARRIDTGTLTLHDPCGCIVGQLCGPVKRGLGFRTAAKALGVGVSDVIAYGLDRDGGEMIYFKSLEAYNVLQDAWIEAIADRLTVSESAARSDAPSETVAGSPSSEHVGVPTRA
jgi:hypothetical protein